MAFKDKFVTFWRQFYILMYKNGIIYLRSWQSLVAQLLAPFIFVTLLFVLEKLIATTPTISPVEKFEPYIPYCTHGDGRCYTLLYMYGVPANSTNIHVLQDSEVETAMRAVAKELDMKVADWNPSKAMPTAASRKTVYRVDYDDYEDFRTFVLDHPNRTMMFITFAPDSLLYPPAPPVFNTTNTTRRSAPAMPTSMMTKDAVARMVHGALAGNVYSQTAQYLRSRVAQAIISGGASEAGALLSAMPQQNTDEALYFEDGEYAVEVDEFGKRQLTGRCLLPAENYTSVQECMNDGCDLCTCNPAAASCIPVARQLAYYVMTNTSLTAAEETLLSLEVLLDRLLLKPRIEAGEFVPAWGSDSTNTKIELSSLLFPQLDESANFDVMSTNGGLFIYCAVMLNIVIFMYRVTSEKELGMRLAMRIVGVSDSAYWLSHFISNLLFVILTSVILLISGLIYGMPFFRRTDSFIVFLVFFMFGLAMTAFGLFLSMLVPKTRSAISVGLFTFILGLPVQLVFGIAGFLFPLLYLDEKAAPYRIVLQFYPPFNFAKSIYDIAQVSNPTANSQTASTNTSLFFTFDTLNREQKDAVNIFTGDTGTLPAPADALLLQLMCFGVYMALAWYAFNTIPHERGRVPWFLFNPNYWLPGIMPHKAQPTPKSVETDSDVQAEADGIDSSTAVVKIMGLRKTFGLMKPKEVVKGISLGLHKDQCFALLGHNGAGKSTLITMMSGALPSSAGNMVVFGKDLHNDLSEMQALLGVCPQHNVLWNELSPRQHLTIFAWLKNVPVAQQPDMIKARLEDVLLWDVVDKPCGLFSGGMKRRLSVALSCIGDPKVVYLDEPTTGLDPSSRREIWNAIHRLKAGRVIVLTTHSMEEADMLGDRIAIMAEGKVHCLGTSLHLKNKFGVGYRLTVSGPIALHEQALELLKKNCPSGQILHVSGSQIVVAVKTDNLPEVLPFIKQIEIETHALKQGKSGTTLNENFPIHDWGLSATTLEEVFFSINSKQHTHADENHA